MGCAASAPLKLQPWPPFVGSEPDQLHIAREIHLIVNPVSGGGKGRATLDRVRPQIEALGIRVVVHVTARAAHAVEIASGLLGAQAVGVIGGDGTTHEVVNGLAYGAIEGAIAADGTTPRALPPVLLIPCGTGNTVAFNCGLRSPDDSLNALRAMTVYHADVLEVTHPNDNSVPRLPRAGAAIVDAVAASAAVPSALSREQVDALRQRVQIAFNMCGWALSTSVMTTANGLRWMGGAQYNAAALIEIVRNRTQVACIQFVDPPEPIPITAGAFAAARSHLEAMQQQHKRGGGYGTASASAGTGASAPRMTGAAAAAVFEDDVEVGRGVVVPAAPADAAAATISSAPSLLPERGGEEEEDAAAESRLMPVPTPHPRGEAAVYGMVQLQPHAFMGAKMAFCPLSRGNDGLMDVCALRQCSRGNKVAILDAAKDHGRHVLGPRVPRRGTAAAALPGVEYCQSRELILWPLDAAQLAAWHAGDTVEPTQLPAGAAAAASSLAVLAGPSDPAARAALARARAAEHAPAAAPMLGPATVNVDGEVSGFTPCRIRVLPRALPLLCCPALLGAVA